MRPTSAIVIFTLAALGGGDPVRAELSGYAQVRYFYLHGVEEGDNYLSQERLRPTFTGAFQELPQVKLTATPQVLFKQGRNEPPVREVSDYLTVERLYLDAAYKSVDLRLGRQDIHWGSAKFWNPTDVFRQTFLADYWAERQGINAVMVNLHLPQELTLTGVGATGDTDPNQNRYAFRGAVRRWNQELALVFMDDLVQDQFVYGFDCKGRYKIGYWAEAAWFHPKQQSRPRHGEIAAGLDYLIPFRKGAAVAVQYYHDGSGAARVHDYDRLLTLFGLRPTLAQDYAAFSGLLNWNKRVTLGLNLIYNLDDDTSFWIPSTNIKLVDGLEVNLGANLFAGPRGGEFHLTNEEQLVEQTPAGTFPFLFESPEEVTEGIADAIYYIWLRWNF